MVSIFASGGSEEVSASKNTAADWPCISTKTPTGVFCTQPVNLSEHAVRYTCGRKPTPCTRPVIKMWNRSTSIATYFSVNHSYHAFKPVPDVAQRLKI